MTDESGEPLEPCRCSCDCVGVITTDSETCMACEHGYHTEDE